MRPSKGEMLVRLERLEGDFEIRGERLDRTIKNLRQLESIVTELAKRNGWRLVYKNGYELVPIKEEPYGN